jgi:hypothetical protein
VRCHFLAQSLLGQRLKQHRQLTTEAITVEQKIPIARKNRNIILRKIPKVPKTGEVM